MCAHHKHKLDWGYLINSFKMSANHFFRKNPNRWRYWCELDSWAGFVLSNEKMIWITLRCYTKYIFSHPPGKKISKEQDAKDAQGARCQRCPRAKWQFQQSIHTFWTAISIIENIRNKTKDTMYLNIVTINLCCSNKNLNYNDELKFKWMKWRIRIWTTPGS